MTRIANILEEFQAVAERQKTSYLLEDLMFYPDEIFSPDGFMPAICRMAELRLRRALNSDKLSWGFAYVPQKGAVLKYTVGLDGTRDAGLTDTLCLATLFTSAQELVGLGCEGTYDLTPVYDYFSGTASGLRNAVSIPNMEIPSWPLPVPARVM